MSFEKDWGDTGAGSGGFAVFCNWRRESGLALQMHKEPAKIRPELFQFISGHVEECLGAQNVRAAGDGVGTRMIGIGKSGSHAVAEEFREIELQFPRPVGAGN